MANFCVNCGSQLGTGAFCGKCGARQSPAAAPASPPPLSVQQPYPQQPYIQQPYAQQSYPSQQVVPAKSGSGLKILLIVLVCFAALGIAAVAGVYYVAHRVKQAVVQKANAYGIELPSSASSHSSRSLPSVLDSSRPCQLLSKDEASRLIAEPIVRVDDQAESCLYFGPPGLSASLAQQDASGVMHRAEGSGNNVTAGEVADSVTKLAASLGAQASPDSANGDMPLLSLYIAKDGKAQMTAITATKAIFGQIPGASAEIPNLGDRAVRVGNLGLNVLKGDTLIRIIPGPIPDPYNRSVTIARELLPKL